MHYGEGAKWTKYTRYQSCSHKCWQRRVILAPSSKRRYGRSKLAVPVSRVWPGRGMDCLSERSPLRTSLAASSDGGSWYSGATHRASIPSRAKTVSPYSAQYGRDSRSCLESGHSVSRLLTAWAYRAAADEALTREAGGMPHSSIKAERLTL